MTDGTGAPRSVLSVPAGDERKLAKALASDADELILDLEDAVPPHAKADALTALLATLPATDWTGVRAQLTVRVNAPGTPWCHTELVALSAATTAPVRAVLVPKAESAGDLHFVDRLLDGADAATGRSRPLAVHALIESAAGIRGLDDIVSSSRRLERLVLGYADLGASLGRQGHAQWSYHQESVLSAARAAGLAALDGPYLGVEDGEQFRAAVDAAADLGFDGKWVIHPRQLAAVNERFTASIDQVRQARRIVDTLAQAHSAGVGAVALDRHMIDEASAVAARRVLARAGRGAP